MIKRESAGLCVVAGVVFASVVSPILISLNLVQPYIIYSIFNPFENAFLSVYAIGFASALLVLNKKKCNSFSISPTGIAYCLIAVLGFQAMGIYMLTMLWLIPWWARQFDAENSEYLDSKYN